MENDETLPWSTHEELEAWINGYDLVIPETLDHLEDEDSEED
jgi:hypothetical protein